MAFPDGQPLVLGLPGTGNHVVSRLVGGVIGHYGDGLQNISPKTPIIIPIRDRDLHWFRSTRRTDFGDQREKGTMPGGNQFTSMAEWHHAHWWPMLNAIAGHRPLIVRYEDIIADPEYWRYRLCLHARCGIREWPEPVRDENAKWREKLSEVDY